MAGALAKALRLVTRRDIDAARRALLECAREGGRDAPWAVLSLIQIDLQRGQQQRSEARLRGALAGDDPVLEWGLGYLFRRCGRAAEGRERIQRASDRGVAAAQVELAALASAASQPTEAERLLARCEETFGSLGDAFGLGVVHLQQAILFMHRGDLPAALARIVLAERAKIAAGDWIGLGGVAQVEAEARYRQSDFSGAMQALDRARRRHSRSGSLLNAGTVLNNIGLWHLDLASPDLAVAAFRRAARCFRRIGDRWSEAAVTANLASAARKLDDMRACERQYGRALVLLAAEPNADAHGIAVAELAEARTREGRPAAALLALGAFADDRRASSAPRTRCQLLGEEARALLALGRGGEALERARRARGLAGSIPGARQARLPAEALAALFEGRAQLARGERRLAVGCLREAARAVEDLLLVQADPGVRMGLVDTYREVHDALVQAFLLDPSRDAAGAWALSASVKARELASGGGAAPASIPRHAALVEYHVSEAASSAFVVHHGEVRVLHIAPGERELGREIRALLEPLKAVGASADPRAELLAFDLARAERLWALLLEPVLALLPSGTTRLILVPDGPLHALPFELLVRRREPAGDPWRALARARFAGDDLALSYAASSRLLRAPGPRSPLDRVLALAYSPSAGAAVPTPMGERHMAPLPGVGAEAREVAALFARRTVLEGSAATPERFRARARGSSVVHIAAHALAEPRSPELSGVVLAPDAGGAVPGYLAAGSIRGLALDAELVTLSACDTGGGRLRAREGVLGLARAFLEAGAGAVLCSHWPVDDAATRGLMTGFYRAYRALGSRAEALLAARRALREQGGVRAHPFSWAPFVLVDHRPGA